MRHHAGRHADALEQNLRLRFPLAQVAHDEEQLSGWVGEVVQTLKSPAHSANLPVDIRGTAFQRRVWAALQEIPHGQTATYEQIASRIGQPRAVRGRGKCLRSEQDRRHHPLPPRGAQRRRAGRLPLGNGT